MIKVKIKGLREAVHNFEKYALRAYKELTVVVIDGSRDITKDAKRLAPVDLGKLRNGIVFAVTTQPTKIEGTITSTEGYSAYVEYGTSPHFPPISALEGWASRHGFGKDGAYIVARSISKKGTPAQPFMLPSFKINKNKIIRAAKRVMKST